MAIEVITWVLEHSESRNGARLVLIAIAERAKANGTGAWPSVKDLMRRAKLSERSVQNGIQELERLGELKVGWNKGPNGSNLYTVLMHRTPAESAPPQDLHPADSAGVETDTESDTIPQDPPQNLHPAESAPPQNLRQPPAESAPEPSLNRPSSSSSKKTRTSPTAKGATGTRIPDDFAINESMAAWCRKEYPRLTRYQADAVTAEFVDYWRGVTGAKGLKADWEATWRNRMRTKLGDPNDTPGQPGLPAVRNGYTPRRATTDERMDQADAALIEAKRIIHGSAA